METESGCCARRLDTSLSGGSVMALTFSRHVPGSFDTAFYCENRPECAADVPDAGDSEASRRHAGRIRRRLGVVCVCEQMSRMWSVQSELSSASHENDWSSINVPSSRPSRCSFTVQPFRSSCLAKHCAIKAGLLFPCAERIAGKIWSCISMSVQLMNIQHDAALCTAILQILIYIHQYNHIGPSQRFEKVNTCIFRKMNHSFHEKRVETALTCHPEQRAAKMHVKDFSKKPD
ncbi:uncharacterized protein V6R79_018440 [Siganus canaliculatus]